MSKNRSEKGLSWERNNKSINQNHEEPKKMLSLVGSIPKKNLVLRTPHKKSSIENVDLEMTNVHSNIKQAKIISNRTLSDLAVHQYDNIMLNVKFGKIQENIPYKTFIKRDPIANLQSTDIILKLEKWISRNKIKSGLIETKDLFKIFSKKSIANYTILCTFTNSDELHREYREKIAGLKYYTPEFPAKGKNLAATKIQSLFHMIFQRKYARKLSSLMKKVKVIQRHWRNCLMMRRTREKMMENISKKFIEV